MIHVDNAVILAAGLSTRFASLSNGRPKSLYPVNGEVLIERQIRQLKRAGIPEIYVVVGYRSEEFSYLASACGVHLIENKEYDKRNNHSSIRAAADVLANSYICSADNYFTENVFSPVEKEPYYSALYAPGHTDEYCLTTDGTGRITQVSIGGSASWYMLGHVLWDEAFSRRFLSILLDEYTLPETPSLLWEQIYMRHLDELTLYIKEFPDDIIWEFDTPEDLKRFEASRHGSAPGIHTTQTDV